MFYSKSVGNPTSSYCTLIGMQRIWIFTLLLLFAVSGLSCDKGSTVLPGVTMLFQENFVIPVGISPFEVHHFQFENVSSRYQQYLNQYKKTDADITGVITTKAAITGIFGDSNLDFIDQVSIRVYDQSNPIDYLEIAYRFPVPLDPGNNLPIIPSLADSKRFFSQPRIAIDVVLWLRKATTEESEVRLNLELNATF